MKGFTPRAPSLFLEHTQLVPASGPRCLHPSPPRTTLGHSWPAPSRQQLGEAPLPRALVQQSPCAHPLWPDPV